MQREDWDKLAQQLSTLPGGAAAAQPDFFGPFITGEAAPITSERDWDGWLLKDGRVLRLRLDDTQRDMLGLFVVDPEQSHFIAQTDDVLLHAARDHRVSAMILFLLALGAGQIDDHKRLKIHAPKIDGAAKDLMLMTVCRLCG